MTTRVPEERPGVAGAVEVVEGLGPRAARRIAAYRGLVARVAVAALAALGLAYLALLAWRLPDLLAALSWNSDAVAPAVLAESLGRDAGPTILGDTSYATTLIFDWLTRGLPGHRVVWALGPVVLALASAGLVGWSASRVGGRRAGIVSALVVAAASPAVLFTQIAPAFHGTTWFAIALLSAALVFLAERPDLGLGRRAAWVAVVALAAGLNLASDPLLGPAGLLPLVLAPVAVRGAPRARALLGTCAAGATAALAVAGGLIGILHLLGVSPRRSAFTEGGVLAVVAPSDLGSRLRNLPETVLTLVAQDRTTALWIVAAAVVAMLLGHRRRSPARRDDATPVGRAYRAFWLWSVVLVAGAYCASGAVSDELSPAQGARYLVPVLLGVAALAGPWAARDDRRLILAALVAGAYVSVNLVALSGPALPDLATHGKLRSVADDVQSYLRGTGVTRGYAGYWDAPVLRYHTGLDVAAMVQCRSGTGHSLCPDRHSSRAGWYAPRSGPSFVVVDPTPRTTHVVSVLPRVERYGLPITGAHFGKISIWIYPYDVATRLEGPWSAMGAEGQRTP